MGENHVLTLVQWDIAETDVNGLSSCQRRLPKKADKTGMW